jgi:hypothetical protein
MTDAHAMLNVAGISFVVVGWSSDDFAIRHGDSLATPLHPPDFPPKRAPEEVPNG